MAALSVIDGGMGCVEDPSHEAAASQQSTEDWAKVTWASDSSQEEGEEIEKVASVDDLADCIKESVKPFAKQIIQVLEKRQERLEYKSNSFSEACAQLKDVCQSCDQQDRLIIAGSDNVGKSTIANALLGGGKFWPTASVCMTSRICEAHYNASSDGQPISKDLVQKGVTSGSEESHCMQKPLQVFHPSPLLKPDVILVDLPGLDQEREYMDRLEEYMKCHSDASVALLYVIDVKDKIRNPDRQFFEKLQRSPWNNLSQSLGLLVNKCDMEGGENGANSDEEPPDYPKLLADITKETQNYCTPKVMDLSMKNKKEDNPAAIQKWQKVEAYASNAVAQVKCARLEKILPQLGKVMKTLQLVVKGDQDLRAEQDKLSQYEAKVEQLVKGKEEWIRRRAEEIQQILRRRENEHLQAVLAAGVPHYKSPVDQGGLDEVDQAICRLIQTMVVNDVQLSVRLSSLVVETFHTLKSGDPEVVIISASVWRLTLILCPAGGVLPAVVTTCLVIATLNTLVRTIYSFFSTMFVDETYVKTRFAQIYQQVIEEHPGSRASLEYDSRVSDAKKDLEERRASLTHLREEAGLQGILDDEFEKECAELQKKFASLTNLYYQMIHH